MRLSPICTSRNMFWREWDSLTFLTDGSLTKGHRSGFVHVNTRHNKVVRPDLHIGKDGGGGIQMSSF